MRVFMFFVFVFLTQTSFAETITLNCSFKQQITPRNKTAYYTPNRTLVVKVDTAEELCNGFECLVLDDSYTWHTKESANWWGDKHIVNRYSGEMTLAVYPKEVNFHIGNFSIQEFLYSCNKGNAKF